MFVVNDKKTNMKSIKRTTFTEQSVKERQHLQEWICKNPESLGEELLIIQKEFSGFSDTNERLDLLALDKNKNLVIIENKLDDSGKDVSWQALKYTSFCSSLTTDDIKNIYQDFLDSEMIEKRSDEVISEFYDEDFEEIILNQNMNQRIILVAAKFRKEVTSTVLWLINHDIDISCIKVIPYIFNDDLLVNFEQIIPIKDAEEYSISIARKTMNDQKGDEIRREREKKRHAFWTLLLSKMNKQSDLMINKSPNYSSDLGTSYVKQGVYLSFVITRKESRIDLYIDTGSKEENERIFDVVHAHKEEIQSNYPHTIRWQRLENKNACRIADVINMSFYDDTVWNELSKLLVERYIKFYEYMKQYFRK